jgi:hypothetical protein
MEESKQTKNFVFVPLVGMRTNDCYLHGNGLLRNSGNKGFIEYVGKDFFVLRDEYHDTPLLVEQSEYWVITENDFYYGTTSN